MPLHDYTIDLTRNPYDRWDVVDPALVSLLAREAYEELHELYAPWQLTIAARGASMLCSLYPRSEFLGEIEGLAAHARVPYRQLLLLNLSYDLASCSVPFPGMLGCSSAIVRKAGDLHIARTMDWGFPASVARHTTVYRFKRPGQEILTVGFPGFVGILSGVTSSGLAMSLNQAFNDARPKLYLPVPWLVREVLTQNTAYEDAQEHLTQTCAASGGFYMLTDGSEGCLVESTGTSDTVHDMREDTEYVAVTNHYREDSEPEDPEWGDSHHRLETLERVLSRGRATKQALLTPPITHAGTSHALVLDPLQRTISICRPNDRQKGWITKHVK